jgi:ferritin-like metal-binding protein YciE
MLEHVKITTPEELFVSSLGSTLKMENTVEEMLGELVDEAGDRELKQQLGHHREETREQIRNVERAFEALGKEADESPCLPIEAIEKEGKAKLKLADDELKDAVILAGCAETEHHEIAVYENLIAHADAMGLEDVVALLRENLEQEQHTLGEVLKAMLKTSQQKAKAMR